MSNAVRRGPGRPPAAKSAETRARILGTAREVFSELGYDAATFQEIADRAGLTRPAINHYFPSKRVLYQQLVEQTNQSLIEAGIDEARRRKSFTDRIRAFVDAAVAAQDRDRSAAAFLVTSVLESRRHPELSRVEHDTLNATRSFLVWALDEAEAAGEMVPGVDPEPVTETLLAMLLGLGVYAGFIRPQEPLTAVTEQFLRLLGGQVFIPGA